MLEVAHALGKSLHEVEEFSNEEIHLHLGFLAVKAEEEKEAYERAKAGSGNGGKWKKDPSSFSRRAK
jgi:hypothetical protein